MNVGDRYSLAWKHPHRIEATIVALGERFVECDVEHRCGIECEIKQRKATLPIEGRMTYLYHEFADMFVPMAQDAIALPSGQ